MVDERGTVIGLLQKEVQDLKTALSDAASRIDVPTGAEAPAVDPHLEAELEKVSQARRAQSCCARALQLYDLYVRASFFVGFGKEI